MRSCLDVVVLWCCGVVVLWCCGGGVGGGGGGGGADPVLMTCVYPYDIAAHAPNSGVRSPGSQTPGDPATCGASTTKNELFIIEGLEN